MGTYLDGGGVAEAAVAQVDGADAERADDVAELRRLQARRRARGGPHLPPAGCEGRGGGRGRNEDCDGSGVDERSEQAEIKRDRSKDRIGGGVGDGKRVAGENKLTSPSISGSIHTRAPTM